jgi:hypothetical protein
MLLFHENNIKFVAVYFGEDSLKIPLLLYPFAPESDFMKGVVA